MCIALSDSGVLTVAMHHCDADGCECIVISVAHRSGTLDLHMCTVDSFIIETQPMLYKMGI